MAKDDISISILDEKIELLGNEVKENKLYLELCFIALLVLVFEIGRASCRERV